MAKSNYRFCAGFGFNPLQFTRLTAILDTGASGNFVLSTELPNGWEHYFYSGTGPDFRDANSKPIRIIGTIDLCVQLGTKIARVRFLVCNKLAAAYILGCSFLDRHVQAILPAEKRVQLSDGSYEWIVHRTPRRPFPLQYNGNPQSRAKRPPARVLVARSIVLQPGTQTRICIFYPVFGPHIVEPHGKLLRRRRVSTTNGTMDIAAGEPF